MKRSNALIQPLLLLPFFIIKVHGFIIKEATISDDIQPAFHQNKLTSRELVSFYLDRIHKLNPTLHAVIEVNPDALKQADWADRERKLVGSSRSILSPLHGIPILLKDNIGTKDELNTTAGSFALLGSSVPRDAGVVAKLRKAGAIILGKASLTEWSGARSLTLPAGWCARTGQGHNPYNLSASPGSSSSGSAIAVAANLVAVSLGIETISSIIYPASSNAAVGIKPTVGLTSRSGIIPVSHRQDSVGPICRTVADAVYVLDEIVGFDPQDAEATRKAAKYIPPGGYKQFLKSGGLKGKRLGIVRNPFFNFPKGSPQAIAFDHHFQTLRQQRAVLVDNLKIANISTILNFNLSGEAIAVMAELKLDLNAYLKNLVSSPVRNLADLIEFNNKSPHLELTKEFGQGFFLAAETTNGIREAEKRAILNLSRLSRNGFEKLMMLHKLDALVTPGESASNVYSIGGFPVITVPAGYDSDGVPFGITFGGLKGAEPKLIEIAYAFEQATQIRKPPSV